MIFFSADNNAVRCSMPSNAEYISKLSAAINLNLIVGIFGIILLVVFGYIVFVNCFSLYDKLKTYYVITGEANPFFVSPTRTIFKGTLFDKAQDNEKDNKAKDATDESDYVKFTGKLQEMQESARAFNNEIKKMSAARKQPATDLYDNTVFLQEHDNY